MADGTSIASVENSVEGPQQKVVVHLSGQEYLDQGYPKHDPFDQDDWAYRQILEKLPDGEIKDAFDYAKREHEARKKDRIDVTTRTSLVPGSEKYAFRGFFRKSNGKNNQWHDNATLASVGENLHAHGIEAPGSEDMILPRRIWELHVFPTRVGIEQRGEDISEILIYRNQPFVLPSVESEETVTKIDMETGKREQISKNEAKEKGYPTLRDIFVGQIEVYYDKI